ncbi:MULTISPECIES: phasin family protein [unclassified Ruegeria]|uniref:phasin family protein n=2 Tax=unclassified Ruegeria TaxID=2625375 RepID=UPI001FD72F2F|nr:MULTISPECIES: phasin family protein [unclassified Ruegeria]
MICIKAKARCRWDNGSSGNEEEFSMSTKKSNPRHPASLMDVFKQMQPPVSGNPAFGAQIEQFWDAQEKMLEETEAFAQHWFERRHEAVRTALQAARKVSSANPSEPTKALQSMTEWQRHSVERLVADAQEWFETVARCAAYVAETEAEAVEKTVDDVATATKSAGKSSKSEPV